MKRVYVEKRPNHAQICADVGFDYHSIVTSDSTYWREGVGYEFTEAEIDLLDDATAELHAMCMDFVQDTIRRGDYHRAYGFDNATKQLIQSSWERSDPHLYGRFDLNLNHGAVHMLEYNADTPTSLLEASVVQWDWLKQVPSLSDADQFNSLHEKLLERLQAIKQEQGVTRMHFIAHEDAGREDWGNVEYLMDVATQAGIDCSSLTTSQIGFDGKKFVDLNDQWIENCFKLYPWEHMIADDFGNHAKKAETQWIEPPWKLLLSNKALLPLLWQRNQDNSLLLPAFFDDGNLPTSSGDWVRKPLLSREGANVTKVTDGEIIPLSGSEFNPEYAKSGHILQTWCDLPHFDGYRPIIGSWVIGNQSAGIGIREDRNVVTGNGSHFVPHYFN